MIARISLGCFIALFTSQLSALERVGQQHALKFKNGKITVNNAGKTNIPIRVREIKSEIDGVTIKLKKITFDMQHTSGSNRTCTLQDKKLELAIMFNTDACEKTP